MPVRSSITRTRNGLSCARVGEANTLAATPNAATQAANVFLIAVLRSFRSIWIRVLIRSLLLRKLGSDRCAVFADRRHAAERRRLSVTNGRRRDLNATLVFG